MRHDRVRTKVLIGGRAADPDALRSRLDSIVAELHDLAPSSPRPRSGPTPAPRWDELIGAVAPGLQPPHPGRRGQLAFAVKRVVRRVLYWYVEPSWAHQIELDRALAQHSEAMSARLDRLEQDVERLGYQIGRLAATTHDLGAHVGRLRHDQAAAGECEA